MEDGEQEPGPGAAETPAAEADDMTADTEQETAAPDDQPAEAAAAPPSTDTGALPDVSQPTPPQMPPVSLPPVEKPDVSTAALAASTLPASAAPVEVGGSAATASAASAEPVQNPAMELSQEEQVHTLSCASRMLPYRCHWCASSSSLL